MISCRARTHARSQHSLIHREGTNRPTAVMGPFTHINWNFPRIHKYVGPRKSLPSCRALPLLSPVASSPKQRERQQGSKRNGRNTTRLLAAPRVVPCHALAAAMHCGGFSAPYEQSARVRTSTCPTFFWRVEAFRQESCLSIDSAALLSSVLTAYKYPQRRLMPLRRHTDVATGTHVATSKASHGKTFVMVRSLLPPTLPQLLTDPRLSNSGSRK